MAHWDKPRVLITGGAGFIGSHLCERYLQQGWEVICVDNLFTGSRSNIAHLLDNPYFEFFRHDIVHAFYAEVDLVLNFACPASPIHYQFNPIKTLKTNVVGTMNMLGLAKRVKARFVQASTSEVYGDPKEHPQKESYWGNVNPIGPRSCYDEGKRVAETLCFDYHRMNGVDIRVVRIFNTYGPRMSLDDGRVVSNFIVQALRGEPITIYGDGSQTRSFCYVDDLVDGIIRFADLNGSETGPINLGNTGEFTIKQLAEEILSQVKSKSQLVYAPLPEDDPMIRKPDISKAQKILNWDAKIPLKDGLKKAIPYFRDAVAKR
jgi:UDP-glucuronate decarboxylase